MSHMVEGLRLVVRMYHEKNLIFEKEFTKPQVRVGHEPTCDIYVPIRDDYQVIDYFFVNENNQWFLIDNVFDPSAKNPINKFEISYGEIHLHFVSAEASVDDVYDDQKTEIAEPTLTSTSIENTIVEGRTVVNPSLEAHRQSVSNDSFKRTVIDSSRSSSKKSNWRPGKDCPVVDDAMDQVKVGKVLDLKSQHGQVIEAMVFWKGKLLSSQQFYPGDVVTLKTANDTGYGLNVDVLPKKINIGFFNGKILQCAVPESWGATVEKDSVQVSLQDLLLTMKAQRKGPNACFFLNKNEILRIPFGDEFYVQLRWAPAPPKLFKGKMATGDLRFQEFSLTSSIVHCFLLILALIAAPGPKEKKKEEPPRFAKIVIQPEKEVKPVPTPKPTPPPVVKKPEPPKKPVLAKKKPKKKIKKIAKKKIKKPKKKITVKKRVAKVDKVENKVVKNKKRSKSKRPRPAMDSVGVLAALGAVTKSSRSLANVDKPVAININKNAGGAKGNLKTNSVIGALKSKSGKLTAGGLQKVGTKGKGFGSGSGYGVQGVKGSAGSRGVTGMVVGAPKLYEMAEGKEEGLTRKQVMDVVKQYLGDIQRCYELALLKSPNLAGRVEYEWLITASGKTKNVKVKKSKIGNGDNLNRCVFGVFRKMKFPKAKNGETTLPSIGFPFGRL